jgi:hypothetical protein
LLRRGLLVDGRGGDQSGQLERLDEPDLADLAGGRLGDEEVAALECAPLGLASAHREHPAGACRNTAHLYAAEQNRPHVER